MSGRGASVAWLAELAAAKNSPAHLLELRFDSGDGGSVYLTDSYRTWSWGGHTWSSAGHLLGFSSLVEAADMRVSQVSVELSGVDQTIIAAFLAKSYRGRPLLIYKLLVNQSTEALIVDPVLIHYGLIAGLTSSDDPTDGKHTLQVSSQDQFADFERTAGRHTNAAEQRFLFPTDGFFDLNTQNAGQQTTLSWG